MNSYLNASMDNRRRKKIAVIDTLLSRHKFTHASGGQHDILGIRQDQDARGKVADGMVVF